MSERELRRAEVLASVFAGRLMMAAHPAEHARQTATLRWVALGILIPNAFSVEAALGRFAGCRYSAIQNNVQTNTYDLQRRGATSSLLSWPRSVGGLHSRQPCGFLRQITIVAWLVSSANVNAAVKNFGRAGKQSESTVSY